jgi:hypothetical protein
MTDAPNRADSHAMRRFVLFLVAFGCALTASIGAANADVITGNCPVASSQPFLSWADPLFYTLAPDGGFEQGGSGWQLVGGASIVSGNEPWAVSGPGTHVLSLPAGSSAWSPPICVGLLHPTMRAFARSSGGGLGLGTLLVEARVTAAGVTLTLPVGTIVAGAGFQPTLPLPLLANLTSPLSGGTGSVQLHFVALGAGFQLDDVYVDPFKTT